MPERVVLSEKPKRPPYRMWRVAKLLGTSVELAAASFVAGTGLFYTGLFLVSSAPLSFLVTMCAITLGAGALAVLSLIRLKKGLAAG